MSELIRIFDLSDFVPIKVQGGRHAWSLSKGSKTAILGAAGVGRSHFLRRLAGLSLDPEALRSGLSFQGKLHMRWRRRHARSHRILYIGKEAHLFPALSVHANVLIGSRSFERKQSPQEVLSKLPIQIRKNAQINDLSIRERKWLHLSRLFVQKNELILLDESDYDLSNDDRETLFELLQELVDRGTTVLAAPSPASIRHPFFNRYIRIRHEGIEESDVAFDELSLSLSLNESAVLEFPEKPPQDLKRKTLLRTDELNLRQLRFGEKDFSIKEGEILGVLGSQLEGRDELFMHLVGDRRSSNSMPRTFFEGKDITSWTPTQRLRAGLAFSSGRRHRLGLFPNTDTTFNLNIALQMKERDFFISKNSERQVLKHYTELLRIPMGAESGEVVNLNREAQQKLLIARWLAMKPKVLFLDEPTRALPQNVRRELYFLFRRIAETGTSLVIFSFEIAELSSLCDRLYVLQSFELKSEFEGGHIQSSEIRKCLGWTG